MSVKLEALQSAAQIPSAKCQVHKMHRNFSCISIKIGIDKNSVGTANFFWLARARLAAAAQNVAEGLCRGGFVLFRLSVFVLEAILDSGQAFLEASTAKRWKPHSLDSTVTPNRPNILDDLAFGQVELSARRIFYGFVKKGRKPLLGCSFGIWHHHRHCGPTFSCERVHIGKAGNSLEGVDV